MSDVLNEQSANEAALLNILMYLDIEDAQDNSINNNKVKDIITNLNDNIYGSSGSIDIFIRKHPKGFDNMEEAQNAYKDRQRQIKILLAACKTNSHFANLKIKQQSRLMNPPYPALGMDGACFTDDDNKNVIIVYRGTGKREWIDNGEGLAGITLDQLKGQDYSTRQQLEAVKYFDTAIQNLGLDESNNIYVSGHSKGGNKAQYVTVNSQNRNLIKTCYNFNGQGFSPEAIQQFKDDFGEDDFKKSCGKMHSICTSNDYVNILGNIIVPEENRHYLYNQISNDITSFVNNHYADAYMSMNGDFSFEIGQGDYSKAIQQISDEIMNIKDVKVRSQMTEAMMALLTNIQGDGKDMEGNTHDSSIVSCIPVFSVSLETLLTTKDGWKVITSLIMDYNDNDVFKSSIMLTAAMYLSTLYLPLIDTYNGIVIYQDNLVMLSIQVIKLVDLACSPLAILYIVTIVLVAVAAVIIYIVKAIEKYRHDKMVKTMTESYPVICFDDNTNNLIIQKLKAIATKISSLDYDFGRLRKNCEWYEIIDRAAIGSIDFVLINNWLIEHCIKYFETCSKEINDVESNLRFANDTFDNNGISQNPNSFAIK